MFTNEQPYLLLQALKLRALREELRGRPVSLTCNALDIATELWLLSDIQRFGTGPTVNPDPADSLWPFKVV